MTQPRGRDRDPPQDPPNGSKPSLDSHYSSTSSNGEARPRRRRAHRENLKDFKVEAPEFDGSMKLEDYLEWVQSLRRFSHFEACSNEKAFKVVVHKLQSYASFWHENTKKQRARDGKYKIRTWTKLKKHMRKHFPPGSCKQK